MIDLYFFDKGIRNVIFGVDSYIIYIYLWMGIE